MPPSARTHREEIHRKISEYRARANGLRQQAAQAAAPELRAVYEELAQQWIALADQLEETLGGVASMPEAMKPGGSEGD